MPKKRAPRCCLINTSSHRVPDSVFHALKKQRGITFVDLVSVPFDISFHPEASPLSNQVSNYLDEVAKHQVGPFAHPGPHFLTVPGVSAAAALVTISVGARLNAFPTLIVVARNPITASYEFKEFVDLAAWYRDQRKLRPLQNGTVNLEELENNHVDMPEKVLYVKGVAE